MAIHAPPGTSRILSVAQQLAGGLTSITGHIGHRDDLGAIETQPGTGWIPAIFRRGSRISTAVIEMVSSGIEADIRREVQELVNKGHIPGMKTTWSVHRPPAGLRGRKLRRWVQAHSAVPTRQGPEGGIDSETMVIGRSWATKAAEAEAIFQALGSPACGQTVVVDREFVEQVMSVAHDGVTRFIVEEFGVQPMGDPVKTKFIACDTYVQTDMTSELVCAFGAVPVEGSTLLHKGH